MITFLNNLCYCYARDCIFKNSLDWVAKEADANKAKIDPYWTCDQRTVNDGLVGAWHKLFDSTHYCGPRNDAVVGGQWFQRTLAIAANSISVRFFCSALRLKSY